MSLKRLALTHPDLNLREHGVIEWLCPHGIGHPIGHITKWLDWMGTHGCDGCRPPQSICDMILTHEKQQEPK